jgi:uncharacterized protein
MCATILALLMTGCASPSAASQPATPTPVSSQKDGIGSSVAQPQPPRVEEITFQSGSFKVVGDLRLPGGTGPFPVILFVHGSGPADRTGSGAYLPIMERMLKAGYATFAWDKPGTDESVGKIDDGLLIQQRAQIILDAIEVLKARPDIAPRRIGLWGISQAGYVMPQALSTSDDIAFMICVSCPGVAGNDQMAFQITAFGLCKPVPDGKAAQKAALLAELDRARTFETYKEYQHYREVLKTLADVASVSLAPYPVASEQTWQENAPFNRGTWNPVEVIKRVKIPVLAIFGDRDRQIDPVQGAHAYGQALKQTGNLKSRVQLFPRANHGIAASETGCPEEDGRWLEQYVKTLGYGSLDEAQKAILADPYRPGLLGDPFAPGYLDLQEEWLRDLRR